MIGAAFLAFLRNKYFRKNSLWYTFGERPRLLKHKLFLTKTHVFNSAHTRSILEINLKVWKKEKRFYFWQSKFTLSLFLRLSSLNSAHFLRRKRRPFKAAASTWVISIKSQVKEQTKLFLYSPLYTRANPIQCDQMAKLSFVILSFTAIKICPIE